MMAPRVLHDDGGSQPLTEARRRQQGSGSPLLDTLAHRYTPHCTPRPSPYIYKRKDQGSRTRRWPRGRTGRRARLAPSLSLSLANACNPLLQAHPPWAQDNTKVVVSPCCFPPLCSVSRRPIWAGTRTDNLLVGLGTPPGSKRRQLACKVGAYCVLTNSFPSSSRWVVFSNLSNPGRCSVSGALSSCPSTAATT
jgi:hypothetical protein